MHTNLEELFEEYGRLDEFTVKDISKIINPTDLPHRDYEPLLRSVKWEGCKQNICKWLVLNSMNGWNTYVQFMDWDQQLQDTSINAREMANLLMWSGDIRFHCTCPAYRFWGMQYICTQLGCAIIPENRFPHVRNPQLKGIFCKHGRKLFRVIQFQRGFIAGAIKRQRDALGIKYQPKP